MAHKMTITMAKSAARPAMITTNRRISRCNVVIDEVSAEESLAMRPLAMSCMSGEILTSGKDGKHAQDSVVADLEDETKARSADAKCPLEPNVLCLEERIRVKKDEHLQEVARHGVPRGCCHLSSPSVRRSVRSIKGTNKRRRERNVRKSK